MQILTSCFLKWRLMGKKCDVDPISLIFRRVKTLIPSISTATMPDMFIFLHSSRPEEAPLDIPRLPSHRFPCEILRKRCWEIPSRPFVKLMVNCCWFGSVGGLGCEGGVPWKSNSPLRHGGISGIQTTKANQHLTLSWIWFKTKADQTG